MLVKALRMIISRKGRNTGVVMKCRFDMKMEGKWHRKVKQSARNDNVLGGVVLWRVGL
jgi:hypothetical protein